MKRRTRQRGIRGALGLAGLALCASAHAGESPAADEPSACTVAAVALIQGRYDAVRDLRAHFSQTTRSVAFGGSGPSSVSRGTVQFAKPGRMRWSYESPEPSLVVSDGSVLWIFDPTHREAQRLEAGTEYVSAAGVHFLLGEGDILDDFRVVRDTCTPTAVELELEPLEPASYERLRVRARRDTGDIQETQLVDLLGNVTVVEFHEIEVNLAPPAETFRFRPPDDVKVLVLDGAHEGSVR